MSVDIREPFALSYFSLYSLALLAFLLYGFMALRLLLKRGLPGLLGFSLLFPWLMFMTEFSTVRIQESFVLYRSYLWAAGAFCLLPVLFHRLNVRMATLILSIIALAMLPISMDRLMTFSHEMLLWDDAEKLVKGRTDLPGAYRIYYNRGTELIKLNKPDLGIADLKQAIALSKDFAEGHGNLGAAYFKKGDWQNAIVSFSKAIEIYRSSGKSISPRYVYGRAQALEKIGDMQKAYVDYQASCRLGNVGCEKTSPVLTTVIPSQK
jgi:tetratricopeptide (TPR) repeat protein